MTACSLFYWRCGDGMKVFDREFRYFEGKPVLVLVPVGRDNGFRYFIKLDVLWKYSDTHNDLFESFIINKIIQLCSKKYYDIPVPKGEALFAQFMVSIATTIMDGIDELVKMPPYREGIDDPDLVIDNKKASDMPDIQVRLMQ